MNRKRKYLPILFCLLSHFLSAQDQTEVVHRDMSKGSAVSITAIAASTSGHEQTVTLKMLSGARPDTVKVVLNGKDVSSRFSMLSCGEAICGTATLTTSDGIHEDKNILYATAKTDAGRVISSRLRMDGGASSHATALSPRVNGLTSKAILGDTDTYLPPSIAFKTLTPGGFAQGSAWIQIGSQTYPTDANLNCSFTNSAQYLVIVLDRQTLTEKTSAPESSPYCATSSAALSSYLSGLSANDLVIVGAIYQKNADYSLDTTAIGGNNYNVTELVPSATPLGYMAIGAVGAPTGQAYENFYTSGEAPATGWASLPTATGMLVEDMNGNYNFQSSDAIEYTVSPNDPGYPNQSIVTVWNSMSQQQSSGSTGSIYTSGSQTIGGYYLVLLQRENLQPSVACTQTSTVNKFAVFQGCGTFYPTGDPSDHGVNATKAYLSLAQALNNLKRNQLAVLTTVGDAAFANMSNPEFQVASTSESSSGPYAYYGTNGSDGFSQALIGLGAPDFDTMYLYHQANGPNAFTYVTAPGLGNPLSGKSVLSTSLYSQQGETGYVHGLLIRDINGLYRPGHTSQESVGADYANFIIGTVSSQQPVEWPETSTTLLPGATSVAGQHDAYAYLSWYLLQYYIYGAQGPHLYDIHYFFTGSLNATIDYHTYIPSQAQWPGVPNFSGLFARPCSAVTNNVCTWTSPDQTQTLNFTQSDFAAVQQQLGLEILYLTNTLQFMTTGSVNMKDVVASGSANTALALVGAAATVQGSSLQPSPSTPVKVDVGNIIGMVGAGLNIVASIGTGGLVPPDLEETTVSAIDTTVDVIGDLLGQAGTVGGGLTTGGTSQNIPSSDYAFETTIGELANSDLQGQMSAGFDATLDVILSDWSKLSQIGPLITDTRNQGFYSPRQSTQNIAINLLNQGTQRSLYLSLVPIKYQLQYWPTVYSGLISGHGYNSNDMGWFQNHVDSAPECHEFYPASQPNVWIGPPSAAGLGSYFSQDWSNPPVDIYVIAAPFTNAGATDAGAQYPDAQLMNTLFSNQAGGLNLPLHVFLSKSGPMANPLFGSTAFFDQSTTDSHGHNLSGYSLGSICSWQQNQDANGSDVVKAPTSSKPITTTTTLTAPSSAAVGDSVVLQATVAAASGVVTVGNVQFRDGKTVLGKAQLDAAGHATFTTADLSLGDHSLAAYYLTERENNASNSAVVTLKIHTAMPDIALSLSADTLQVSYKANSTAVTLQLASVAGMSGTVKLGCSGLPVGMACQFNPAAVNLNSGDKTTSSVTITPSDSTKTVSILGWFALPAGILSLYGRKRRFSSAAIFAGVMLSCSIFTGFVGCSGNNQAPSQNTVQEAGTKLVLVTATSGSLTRTIPLTVTIQ